MDVIGAARSAVLVGIDPNNPEARVIAHVKHNLSTKGESWSFAMRPKPGGLPELEWLGHSEVKAEDLVRSSAATLSPHESAARFLEEMLKNGKVPAKKIYEAANESGISDRTLERQKELLGVRSVRIRKAWYWSLPKANEPKAA